MPVMGGTAEDRLMARRIVNTLQVVPVSLADRGVDRFPTFPGEEPISKSSIVLGWGVQTCSGRAMINIGGGCIETDKAITFKIKGIKRESHIKH